MLVAQSGSERCRVCGDDCSGYTCRSCSDELWDSQSEDPQYGQATLTRHEICRLPMGNQHTKWNVIRWQCVKAAAKYHGVRDWTSKVDTSLSYRENISLMQQRGAFDTNATMRNMPFSVMEKR